MGILFGPDVSSGGRLRSFVRSGLNSLITGLGDILVRLCYTRDKDGLGNMADSFVIPSCPSFLLVWNVLSVNYTVIRVENCARQRHWFASAQRRSKLWKQELLFSMQDPRNLVLERSRSALNFHTNTIPDRAQHPRAVQIASLYLGTQLGLVVRRIICVYDLRQATIYLRWIFDQWSADNGVRLLGSTLR